MSFDTEVLMALYKVSAQCITGTIEFCKLLQRSYDLGVYNKWAKEKGLTDDEREALWVEAEVFLDEHIQAHYDDVIRYPDDLELVVDNDEWLIDYLDMIYNLRDDYVELHITRHKQP